MKQTTFSIGLIVAACMMALILLTSGVAATPKRDLEREPSTPVTPRIVGGEEVVPGSYPWHVRVRPENFLCGGSLIEAEWVLTAAHCLYHSDGTAIEAGNISVVLGDHRKGSTDDDGTEQVIEISEVVPHPNYRVTSSDYDVALLKLAQPANLIPNQVETIALSADELIPAQSPARVTGWGLTAFGGATSNALQVVEVPIVSDQVCNTAYGGGITVNMICAGSDVGGKDACLGDSGGPLVIDNGRNGFKQIGIVSFGIGCADARYPGVYARTSRFNDWIFSTIGIVPTPTPVNTPVPPPTRTPTVSPTPIEPTPIVLTATPGSNAEELLTNGSFDESPAGSGWVEGSTFNFDLIDSFSNENLPFQPVSAPNFVWLGGREGEVSRISQALALPSDGRLRLSFEYALSSLEDGCGFDRGRVLVNTTIVMTIDLCDDNYSESWRSASVSLDRFVGQLVTIGIETENDDVNRSSFYVDNVSLAYEPGVQPIPTVTPVLLGGSLYDGDFESGSGQFWQTTSSNGLQIIQSDVNTLPIDPYSGSYLAWLGGSSGEQGSISENFRPDADSNRVTFFYAIQSDDDCGHDTAEILFNGIVLKSYSLCEETATAGWVADSLDLTRFEGVNGDFTVRIFLDSLFDSSFFVDQFETGSITSPASTPVPTAGPTPNVATLDLNLHPGENSMSLVWHPLYETQLDRYRVLRAEQSHAGLSGYEEIGSTTFPSFVDRDGTLMVDTTYLYRVEALDQNNRVLAISSDQEGEIGFVYMEIPDVVGVENRQMIVPVNIVNGSGIAIEASDIWIDYDSSIIRPVGLERRQLAAAYTISSNIENPIGIPGDTQRIKINLSSDAPPPIYGNGTLFWITFDVIGEDGDRGDLNLREFFTGLGGSTLSDGNGDGETGTVPLLFGDGRVTVAGDNRPGLTMGDIDGDGDIDGEDLSSLIDQIVGRQSSAPVGLGTGDINGDGRIDVADGLQLLHYVDSSEWPALSGTARREPVADSVGLSLSDIDPTGETGPTVDLSSIDLSEIEGLQFSLVYDPSLINSVVNVALLSQVSDAEIFDFYEVEPGHVVVVLGRRSGINGSLPLMRFVLDLAEGDSLRQVRNTALTIGDLSLTDSLGLNYVENYVGNSVFVQPSEVDQTSFFVYLPVVR